MEWTYWMVGKTRQANTISFPFVPFWVLVLLSMGDIIFTFCTMHGHSHMYTRTYHYLHHYFTMVCTVSVDKLKRVYIFILLQNYSIRLYVTRMTYSVVGIHILAGHVSCKWNSNGIPDMNHRLAARHRRWKISICRCRRHSHAVDCGAFFSFFLFFAVFSSIRDRVATVCTTWFLKRTRDFHIEFVWFDRIGTCIIDFCGRFAYVSQVYVYYVSRWSPIHHIFDWNAVSNLERKFTPAFFVWSEKYVGLATFWPLFVY